MPGLSEQRARTGWVPEAGDYSDIKILWRLLPFIFPLITLFNKYGGLRQALYNRQLSAYMKQLWPYMKL
jgi:hypothetical protein